MPKKDVTMTDVARYVGVSISTVSRVINNTATVSDELRNQILEAIHLLGYTSARTTRALNISTVSTIAVVIPTVNPFFADIIRGIQEICFANNHTVAIYNSDEDPEKEMIHTDEFLLKTTIKGVIFAGTWGWEPF